MSHHAIPQYSVVDLFAGAGGLSCGFLQTGRFTVKAAFEVNHDARMTYQRNHGDQTLMYSDVNEALSPGTKEKIGEIDVLIGGPPCQGFSNVNRQRNHAICQNNILVKRFVHAVLHLNPMAFVMENVDMLQSDVYRFYVDKNDEAIIRQYGIATSPAEIVLLDEAYLFEDAVKIIEDKERVAKYLWSEKHYFVLNVVYKVRNNSSKLKSALSKYKSKLIEFSKIFSDNDEKYDHVAICNAIASDAINRYYSNMHTDINAQALCKDIEHAIMIQRMLSKVMEIYNNNIVVSEYSADRKLTAKVISMGIVNYIESVLCSEKNGYKLTKGILSAAAFGVPQKRMRFVIMGIKGSKSSSITMPTGGLEENDFRTVEDAIKDLEGVKPDLDIVDGDRGIQLVEHPEHISSLGKQLRNSPILYNHIVTETTPTALARFKAIKQGENFHSLPPDLKSTYSDAERTQNTIYLRLKYNEPSGTVVNVRKSMWIHPVKDRAISIREAARLQTFPDSFVFCGLKNSQYQQIGNAVPPLLAKAIAEHLCTYLDNKQNGND